MHGLVLALLSAIEPVRAYALASTGQFAGFALAAVGLALALAHVVHVLIETPGIRLGRRLADRWLELRRVSPILSAEHVLRKGRA